MCWEEIPWCFWQNWERKQGVFQNECQRGCGSDASVGSWTLNDFKIPQVLPHPSVAFLPQLSCQLSCVALHSRLPCCFTFGCVLLGWPCCAVFETGVFTHLHFSSLASHVLNVFTDSLTDLASKQYYPASNEGIIRTQYMCVTPPSLWHFIPQPMSSELVGCVRSIFIQLALGEKAWFGMVALLLRPIQMHTERAISTLLLDMVFVRLFLDLCPGLYFADEFWIFYVNKYINHQTFEIALFLLLAFLFLLSLHLICTLLFLISFRDRCRYHQIL